MVVEKEAIQSAIIAKPVRTRKWRSRAGLLNACGTMASFQNAVAFASHKSCGRQYGAASNLPAHIHRVMQYPGDPYCAPVIVVQDMVAAMGQEPDWWFQAGIDWSDFGMIGQPRKRRIDAVDIFVRYVQAETEGALGMEFEHVCSCFDTYIDFSHVFCDFRL